MNKGEETLLYFISLNNSNMLPNYSLRIWMAVSICFVLLPNFLSAQTKARFTLLGSRVTGIDFNNKIKDTKEKNILLYANFYGGAGVGVADFNNDGLQDIFLPEILFPTDYILIKVIFILKMLQKTPVSKMTEAGQQE